MLLWAMARILFAWVGDRDKREMRADEQPGPILRALRARSFDQVVLLSNRPKEDESFVSWLRLKTRAGVHLRPVELKSPTHYPDIYRAASGVVAWAQAEFGKGSRFTFHLSPGTPAMSSIWIILAKTRFPAALIQSSPEAGVEDADVPFEIAAEFVPDLVRAVQDDVEKTTSEVRPEAPEFKDVLHRSIEMGNLIRRARQAAVAGAPVLIEGESGTGKELIAQAIHGASGRPGRFIAINCGAISPELFESEMFGHKRGAFTGADETREGHFEAANGGTLFLDEIGDLPLDKQVKLLRALQTKTVVRVGESRQRPVDVRVVAATNRPLRRQIAAGAFREDLFYRVAILVLTVPPLRERAGDVGLLVDHFLAELNKRRTAAAVPKTLSVRARKALLNYDWPGNVRELEGTLQRAFVWSSGAVIEERDVREALFGEMEGGDQEPSARSPARGGLQPREDHRGSCRPLSGEGASGGWRQQDAGGQVGRIQELSGVRQLVRSGTARRFGSHGWRYPDADCSPVHVEPYVAKCLEPHLPQGALHMLHGLPGRHPGHGRDLAVQPHQFHEPTLVHEHHVRASEHVGLLDFRHPLDGPLGHVSLRLSGIAESRWPSAIGVPRPWSTQDPRALRKRLTRVLGSVRARRVRPLGRMPTCRWTRAWSQHPWGHVGRGPFK